ncbi:MAG: ATP-binding protein [Planctomycetota bacterium]
MKQQSHIVWKLNVVVITIVSLVIVVFAWFGHLAGEHYTRESARQILGFHSASIVQGVEDLMMSNSRDGLAAFLEDLSAGNPIYDGLRVVSHEQGQVVVCRSGAYDRVYTLEDWECAVCHDLEDPERAGYAAQDTIVDAPRGGRLLAMVTPFVNRPSCRSDACHAHAEDGEILGLLAADYSLAALDPSSGSRLIRTVLVTALAVAFSGLILGLLLRRLVQVPIGRLIEGTRRIAEGNLSFQFPAKRKDEIGELERSFNAMTTRVRTHQAELRDAMEYLQGIIENSADIIITVTPRGNIQTFNRGAEQALGYRREEIQGQRIELLFADPKDREYALNQLVHTDNVRNFRTDFRAKSGEIRHVLLTLSRLRDAEGNPIGTFGISKDITEERRLIRQVIQSKKLAAIGEAVTGIQHAVKNMLNALKGGSYLVKNGIQRNNMPRIEEGWGMVEEGIERMTTLSLSLLNYAKDWRPEIEPVDLNGLVAKIHAVFRETAASKGIALTVHPAPGPADIRCDPRLVHMGIVDIVSNAIDACAWKDYPEGETPRIVLSVRARDGGQSYEIEVGDNGCGMTKGILKNIFTPFFSTKKQWGTGLGLALTSRVIDVHGGTIDVESEPGKGSMFRIVLPTSGPRQRKESADGQEGSADRR